MAVRVALHARRGRWPGRPGSRARGSGPPCRTPRRRRRRWSSRAAGSGRGPPSATSSVWPPDTSSTTSGSSRSGSSRSAAYRWASRWFTATNGTSHTRASALAALTPDEQRADEAGTDGGGDRVDVVVVDAGLDEGLGDDRGEQLDVGPAGDLGHDAAEAGVQVDLAATPPTTAPCVAVDHDRRRRLVARRLDAEDRGVPVTGRAPDARAGRCASHDRCGPATAGLDRGRAGRA